MQTSSSIFHRSPTSAKGTGWEWVYALTFTIGLHALFLLLLIKPLAIKLDEEPEVLRINLVEQPSSKPKPVAKPKPRPKPKAVKNQVSTAPKEAPQKAPEPTKAKPPVVSDTAKKIVDTSPKAQEKTDASKQAEKLKEKPEEKPAEKRPAKLDKRPDMKKILKELDPLANTIQTESDFLDALDFIDDFDLEPVPQQVKTPQEPTQTIIADKNLKPTLADQADIATVKKHVEKFWVLPPELYKADTLSVTVEAHLDRNGSITLLKVIDSSGEQYFDNSLLRAVRRSAPIPIPVDKYELFRILELNFGG